MATYYARNVAGNWASATSWDNVSSGGAGPAGPPVAGDTAIFDADFDAGNITVAVAAACSVLTVQAGATGTLTISAALTITGNITFVAGFNIAGTSSLILAGNGTLATGGLSIPNLQASGSTYTRTLQDDLNVSGTLTLNTDALTFAGAFDIYVATLTVGQNLTYTAGQTLTVSTAINAVARSFGSLTIKSGTASADAFLHYNGLASACKVAGITFTDINCTHAINNWYGGTLLRTTGIYNVTAASIPAVADVKNGVGYGGVDDAAANQFTGTYVASGVTVGPFEAGAFR